MSQQINLEVSTGAQGPTGPTGPAGATGAGGGGGGGSSSTGFSLFEEFLGQPPYTDGTGGATLGQHYGGALDLWINPSGTGAATGIASTQIDAPGVLVLDTGSTSTGFVSISNGNIDYPAQSIKLGGGALTWEGRIGSDSDPSDGTDRYILKAGVGNTNNDTVQAGIWFDAVDGVNSGKWVARTSNGLGADDEILSSVDAPTYGEWAKLGFVTNAAASSVEFFIDGSSIGSLTTGIPTFLRIGISCGVFKRLGTGTRQMNIDYLSLSQVLTTPR